MVKRSKVDSGWEVVSGVCVGDTSPPHGQGWYPFAVSQGYVWWRRFYFEKFVPCSSSGCKDPECEVCNLAAMPLYFKTRFRKAK